VNVSASTIVASQALNCTGLRVDARQASSWGRSRPSRGGLAFAAQASGLGEDDKTAWRRAWDGPTKPRLMRIKPLDYGSPRP